MVAQMHQKQVTSVTITIDDDGSVLRGHDLVGASAHGNPPKTTPPRDHAWHRRIVGTKNATTVIDCDGCARYLLLMHLNNHASL